MGFNRRDLPDLNDLQKIRGRYTSDQEFLEKYLWKVDAISGPSESMNYIRELRKKVQDEQGMGKGS